MNSFQSKATQSLSVVNMAHSGFKLSQFKILSPLYYLLPICQGSKFPGLLCIILALWVGYLVQRIPLFSLSSVQRELVLPGSYCHVIVSTAAHGPALASLLRDVYFVFSLYGSKVPLVF